MIASVHSTVGLQREFVVGIAAKLQSLPRHDRELGKRHDAGVLNDKKIAPAGTHIRSNISAFEQFLSAYAFDVIFRRSASIDELERRLRDSGAHGTALRVPNEQRQVAYIRSTPCDSEIFCHSAWYAVARGIHNRTKHVSDASLLARIAFQFGPIYIPTYAEKITNRIAAMIASMACVALRIIFFIPLRCCSPALPLHAAQLVEAGTQYKPSLHTSPRRGASRRVQFQTL